MQRAAKGFWLFLVLSLAVHVAVCVVAWKQRAPNTARPPVNAEIEFSLVGLPEPTARQPRPPAAPAAVAAPATAPRSPRTTPKRPAIRPAPTSPAAHEPSVARATPEPAAPESDTKGTFTPPPSAAAGPAADSGKTLDLSPRSVALSAAAPALGARALHCSPERQASSAASCETDDLAAHTEAELERNLHAVAQHVPHLKARDKPALQRRSDGSYAYTGHVFEALVRRDGHVEFADSATKATLQPSWVPFKLTLDLADAANKLRNKELYTEEKRWFLAQTAELRAQLAAAFRKEEAARARRALELELERIVEAHELSPGQKREAVFALWQDCGEDSQAEQVRRAVEAFVRRRMPEGSPLGFTSAELARLNAGRANRRAFAPYRLPAAGAPG